MISQYSAYLTCRTGQPMLDLTIGTNSGDSLTIPQARQLAQWLTRMVDEAEKTAPQLEQHWRAHPDLYSLLGTMDCSEFADEMQTPLRDNATSSVPGSRHHG